MASCIDCVPVETAAFLLRNLEYCGYAGSAGKVFRDLDSAEQKFNQVSMEERSKFKQETYVNVDGRRKSSKLDEGASGEREMQGGRVACKRSFHMLLLPRTCALDLAHSCWTMIHTCALN